jgi:hypothetical protein
VELAPPDELLQRDSQYARLWNMQDPGIRDRTATSGASGRADES